MPPSVKSRDLAGLVLSLALCLGVSGIGGAITRSSVSDWYQGLAKPWFNPPDWVFAPVWITLYIFMGVAAWLVWRKTGFRRGAAPLAWFGAQLALNLGWSALFFGLRSVGWALAEIAVLWAAILVTALHFRRISPAAGLLLMPYLLWVSFATALNAAIWWLNRS